MLLRPRRLILPAVLLAALAGAYIWWREERKPAPVAFNTATITRGTLTQTVTATGDLQPVSTIEVSSQISGLIREVLVDYNSHVKAGDVLARIDPATYENRLRQAEAELANTRANHQLVRLNAERIRSLRDRNLVSQQELDQAEAQLAQADAQLLIRTAAVETVKVDLARCTITAPIDGIVLDRPATVGKTVAASLNAPVLFVMVNDLSQLQIKAAISEADIGNVKVGQTSTFTVDAFPDRSFRGIVRQIRNQPVVQSNVVTYATLIDVANDNLALKPGMTANVSVTVEERPDVLLVPNAALRARVPEDLRVPADPAPGSDGKPDTAAGALKALLAEVGYKEAPDTRPNREQMQRVRALASERGIVLPERRRGVRGPGESPSAETVRTLFLQVDTQAGARAKPVEVKLGITDGLNTEVIAGLEDKARVITSLVDNDSASSTPAGGANNPFLPGGNRQRRY